MAVTVTSAIWRVDVYGETMRALTGAEGTYHQEVSANGDATGGLMTLQAQLLDPPASKWLWRVKEVYAFSDGLGEALQMQVLWSIASPVDTIRVNWHVEAGTGGPANDSPGRGRDQLMMKDRLMEVGAGGGDAIALIVELVADNANGRVNRVGVNLEYIRKVRGLDLAELAERIGPEARLGRLQRARRL